MAVNEGGVEPAESTHENGELENPAVGDTTSSPAELTGSDKVVLGDLSLGPGEQGPHRDKVEPYLAALLQAEHLNLLVGSGLTTALGDLAGHSGGPDMNAGLAVADSDLATSLEESARSSAMQMGRGEPNIEDRLRVAIAAVEGLSHIGNDQAGTIHTAVETALASLRNEISSIETALREAVDAPVGGSMSLRGVLMTFLGSFAGRAPTRDRLHLFTTNYDRVIEWGAEQAGLRIVDRFVGTLEPVFRSSRLELDYHYSPPGTVREPRHLDGVFRLTKLHGSLDWHWQAVNRRLVRTALPFGEASTATANELLIYPNAAKDVETAFYPYSDLFRDFSAALCRHHSALITYGYSFGDDHINRVIKDMLTIPSTHLLVISNDEAGRIRQFADDHRRLGQVSLLLGPTMASLKQLVNQWLPWPSAEFLLQRRAQIYRNRNIGSATGRDHTSEASGAHPAPDA